VFVVWEPVLPTDWTAPEKSLPSFIWDSRVRHYYDKDRKLSAALGGPQRINSLAADAQVAFRMKDVIWDAALVYAPGVKWGQQAKTIVAPVVKYREQIAAAL